MLYLAIQMAVFLVLAASAGIVAGWWANRIKNSHKQEQEPADETNNDLFALKHRLDKCFDENAALRRDLKSSNIRLEKLNKDPQAVQSSADDEELQEKIRVLMDDLQIRDDTIIALEKELELVRNQQSA